MSRLEVARRAEHEAMPWRNGGGITHELGRAGTHSADFDWRVSIAEIEAAGPFSAFPGVDRIITLLEGPWLDLTVDGTRHRLAPLEPFAFDGGAETVCDIPSRTVDLNVMCRAGRFAADVRVLHVEEHQRLPATDPLLLVCLSGEVEVTGESDTARLTPWDLATVTGGRATVGGAGVVAVVELTVDPGAAPR